MKDLYLVLTVLNQVQITLQTRSKKPTPVQVFFPAIFPFNFLVIEESEEDIPYRFKLEDVQKNFQNGVKKMHCKGVIRTKAKTMTNILEAQNKYHASPGKSSTAVSLSDLAPDITLR